MISCKSYNSEEMCTLLGISITTLWRYHNLALIPKSTKIRGRRKWSRELVDHFMEAEYGVADKQKPN